MKGLLYKDLTMIWRSFKMYLLVSVLFLVMAVYNENNFFFLFYPAVLGGMLPIQILGFDEKSGWDRYSMATPMSRAQLVTSKYLIALLCACFVTLLYGASLTVRALATGGDWGEMAVFLPILLTICLLPPSIMLPCAYKFGTQKGGFMYYIVIGVMVGIIVGISNLGYSRPFYSMNISTIHFLTILSIACVLLYALSWLLSVRIMSRKDF